MRLLRGTAFGRFVVAGYGGRGGGHVCELTQRDVTADTTAAPCEWLRVDASAGPITITPPAAPAEGCMFAVEKIDDGNTIAVTITGLRTLYVAGAAVAYRWDGAAWGVVASEDPPCELQPLIHAADLVAAYAFNEPAADCNLDRSGKGLNFNAGQGDQLASELANVMDAIPGKGACIAAPSFYATSPARARKLSQNFVQYGAITVTMRVWLQVPVHVPNTDYSLCYLNATDTSNGSVALQWVLATKASPNRYVLAYYAERFKSGLLHLSTTLEIVPNEWMFLSLRRYADGTVRQGVHRGKGGRLKTYQTGTINDINGTPLQLPASANTANFAATFCEPSWTTDQHSYAPFADWALWGGRTLTDAEIDAQAVRALRGLP